jgi:hypothetical protein
MSNQVSYSGFTLSGSYDTDLFVAGQIYQHASIGHDFEGFSALNALGETCQRANEFVADYFSYLLATEHPAIFQGFKFEILPVVFPNSYVKVVFLRLRSLPTYLHSDQIPLLPADEKNRLALAGQVREEINRASCLDAKEKCLQVCQEAIGLVEATIQSHSLDKKDKLAIFRAIESDFGLALRVGSCLTQETFSYADLPQLLEILQAEVAAWGS